MKKATATFKKQSTAHRYSRTPSVDIKIKKRVCGIIYAPKWGTEDDHWSISFMVKKTEPEDNPNCDWKWITMNVKFKDESGARDYVKNIIQAISEEYELHFFKG